jgi:hypothetical protein
VLRDNWQRWGLLRRSGSLHDNDERTGCRETYHRIDGRAEWLLWHVGGQLLRLSERSIGGRMAFVASQSPPALIQELVASFDRVRAQHDLAELCTAAFAGRRIIDYQSRRACCASEEHSSCKTVA